MTCCSSAGVQVVLQRGIPQDQGRADQGGSAFRSVACIPDRGKQESVLVFNIAQDEDEDEDEDEVEVAPEDVRISGG